MNRTITANLGGQVFVVDENAFEKLNKYIESIKERFAQTEGKEEIINDIETRIAEIFSQRLKAGQREVVNMADVDEAVSVMGWPEDFEEVDEGTEGAQEAGSSAQEEGGRHHLNKRLFRNPDDKVLGGVASGISAYFGINDPLWLRLLFVVLVIAGIGTFILIYILLWIIVPEAKTPSEKLQMRGENVTISNIEGSVKREFDNLKNRFNSMNSNQTMNAVGAFLSKLIDFVVNLLRYVVYFGVKVVGVLLIISGIAIVLSMIFGFTLPFGLPDFQWTPITNAVFASNLEFVLGAFGLLLLVGIPGLAIVYLGFRMLMDTRARIKGIVPSMLGLWIMGLLLVGVISTLVASDFRYKEEMEQTINLDEPSSGKMYLDTMKDTLAKNANNNVVRLGNFDMRIVDDQILLEDAVTLNIQKAETNDWKLLVNRSARGGSEASARRHAQHAEAMITQTDSMLKVNPNISLGKSQKWRAQQVDLTLLMPEGREIVLTEASREVIYDIANVHDMYDGDMVGHTWEMRSKGLTCKDCSGNEASKSSVAGNSRSYDIRDFDEVEIKGAFDVKMRYADEYKVVLKGEQGLLDDVDVTLQQEQLSISKQEGVSDIFNGGNIRVKVESPELEELALKGAGESSVIGYSGQSCEVTLAGATESDMNVEYEELSVDVLGASNLHLVGSGEKLKAKVLGASSMSGENYETAEADIEVAGSSNASIHVTKTLKAEVMGASELSYKGDPDIESDVAGFSSINPL